MANHSCEKGCNHGISVNLFDSDKRSQQGTLEVRIEETSIKSKNAGKTTMDVAGICCPSEVPLIRKLIEPLPGVHEVLVNVTAKTVTVHHDPALTSPSWLVKVLNDAKLEASIHHKGEWKATHKWPSPYTIASGFMVALTFFQYVYSPLKWVGLGAVAVGAPPIIIRALVSLRRFILDINVLMIIAVSGAIGLGDYLEAGSIVFLFTLADWLESRSSDKARMAIAAVANLAPQHAFLADDGLKVPVGEVTVGTRIAVKAGELVPIDGSVVSGKSTIDESSLTGEPLAVEKVAGATVWAGTLNLTGYLCIETTALAEDSAVARMIRLVEEAQTGRSHIERLVEKFAKFYTPVILIIAIVTATLPLALHVHNARHWLYLALVLLVAACPCALVISTPVTTTCAIAQAARIGLVVKGGDSLEALGKLKMIAMDKTGTLTEGQFRVKEVCLLNNDVDLLEVLYWIACIENKASHPMASSFVAYAKMHGIIPSGEVKDFEVLVGEGVTGVLDGRVIHIGNERMAKRLHWNESNHPMVLETWKSEGWTVTWVGIDEKLQAVLCAGDHLRPEAKEALSALRKIGIQITMLTGDCQAAADIVQKKLGDLNVHAQLLPKDKVEILKQLKKMGLTGMVGDGTNDAPALASADVGIAMGVAGSAMAMEAADISLMTNDLRQLPTAVKLGRRAFQKIIQNIILSLCTKTLIIILAVLGYASLWAAVLADVGTCLLVIFNSMLLLERQKGKSKSHGDHKERTHHHHSHCAHGESNHDHHHSHCEHKESKHDHQHNHGIQEECKQDLHHSHGGHEQCKHDPHHQQSNHGHHHHHEGRCNHEESKHDDHHNYCGHNENKHKHYKECTHGLCHSHGDTEENKHGDNCGNEEKKHEHNHYSQCDHEESKHDDDHCHCDHDETKHGHQHSDCDHDETKHGHHSDCDHDETKHGHHHSHCEHEEKHGHHHSHCDHEVCKHDHYHSHGNHEKCKLDDHDHHDHHHGHCNHEENKHDHHQDNHWEHIASKCDHHGDGVHEECKDDQHDHEASKHEDDDDHSCCDHEVNDDHNHCNRKECRNDDHNHCDHKESNHNHHHSHEDHEECKHDHHDNHEASKHDNHYHSHFIHKQSKHNHQHNHHNHEGCKHDHLHNHKLSKHEDDYYSHCDHKDNHPSHGDYEEYKHDHHHSNGDHKSNRDHDHHLSHYSCKACKHDDDDDGSCRSDHYNKTSEHNHDHSHNDHPHCEKRIIWLQSSVNCLAHLRKSSDNKKLCCHKRSDCGGNHPLSTVCCESKIPIPPKKKMLSYGDKTGHRLCFHIPKKVASFTEEDLSSVTQIPKSKDIDEFLCAIYCCEILSHPGDKNACCN